MKWPKISIITPSYNQGKYLEQTILSVISQNYPNYEYLIIDGKSTDNSVEIIKKHEKHLSFWVSEKDNGQSHALNKGFKLATGDIFCWINSDDFFYPGIFNKMASEFLNNSDVFFIHGYQNHVDEFGIKLYETYPTCKNPKKAILYGGITRQLSCFFKKESRGI